MTKSQITGRKNQKWQWKDNYLQKGNVQIDMERGAMQLDTERYTAPRQETLLAEGSGEGGVSPLPTSPRGLKHSKPSPPHRCSSVHVPLAWAHPLPCPKLHFCSFKPSGDPPSVFATDAQLLFSLKVTWSRIILPSVVPSTHSKKYLPVNNYLFKNR